MKERARALYGQRREQIEVPFHKQEAAYSCVPACLRMVLAGLGLDLTEKRLRELCDCSPLFGTQALRAIGAARARLRRRGGNSV